MKISENTFVELDYALKVAGEVVDKSPEGSPLAFVFGAGFLLPQFEKNIEGLGAGDKFEFTLSAEDGYGELVEEAVVELPQSVFMIDGKVEDGLLVVGNQIPMATADGQRMLGIVKEVGAETATLDFNHPMAGKVLDFSGTILAVRQATDADRMPMGAMSEGCDCDDSSSCGDGCSCGCK